MVNFIIICFFINNNLMLVRNIILKM